MCCVVCASRGGGGCHNAVVNSCVGIIVRGGRGALAFHLYYFFRSIVGVGAQFVLVVYRLR